MAELEVGFQLVDEGHRQIPFRRPQVESNAQYFLVWEECVGKGAIRFCFEPDAALGRMEFP
jgi:hypothetical protein